MRVLFVARWKVHGRPPTMIILNFFANSYYARNVSQSVSISGDGLFGAKC